MNETFLETVQTLRAGDASAAMLFGGDGYRARGRRLDPAYQRNLVEAARFLADIYGGRRPIYHLQEVMTTSDFPLLFGDILDRQILASYREWPVTWPSIARRATVRDFRSVKRFPPAAGGDSRLEAVDEQAPYPEAKIDEQAAITYAVRKYGRRIAFSWEAIMNDDLDQLRDVPVRMGRSARRTEQRFVTELFVDANGPHASLYNTANKNRIHTENGASTNNPAFGVPGLRDAFKVIAAQKDETGEPIFLEMVTLVVPPALEVQALEILNATQLTIDPNLAAGSAKTMVATGNWMRNRVRLVVDPYIPLTATTANGNTSWFLFGDPAVGRPAIEVGFLVGHEEPEVWIKEANARRVGGGAVDPMDGDFDTDSIQYRVRHVLGGTRVDHRATVASNGSGA